MRKIKFRGKDIRTGEYVFAELGQVSVEIKPAFLTFITDEDTYIVDAETIQQFCGVDDNGEECYEGDYMKIVTPDGKGGVTDFLSDRPLVLESELGRPSIDVRSRPFNYYKLVLDKERSRRND